MRGEGRMVPPPNPHRVLDIEAFRVGYPVACPQCGTLLRKEELVPGPGSDMVCPACAGIARPRRRRSKVRDPLLPDTSDRSRTAAVITGFMVILAVVILLAYGVSDDSDAAVPVPTVPATPVPTPTPGVNWGGTVYLYIPTLTEPPVFRENDEDPELRKIAMMYNSLRETYMGDHMAYQQVVLPLQRRTDARHVYPGGKYLFDQTNSGLEYHRREMNDFGHRMNAQIAKYTELAGVEPTSWRYIDVPEIVPR
jgi:hypothetical protein